jgi:DNA-binding NarL/FixJ family response regulator
MSLMIVDDHDAFRSFASTMLSHEGFDVVAVAHDGEAALSALETVRPDAVLLDLQLPGIDGFEVARRLASASSPRVVLMSSREASDYGSRLTAAPAAGFISKLALSGDALVSLLTRR